MHANQPRRAHQKVRILAGILLFVVATVVVVASAGLLVIRGDVRHLVAVDIPASSAVSDLERELLQAELALEESITLPSADERFRATERFDRAFTRAGVAWTALRSTIRSIDQPTREAFVAYETLLPAWKDGADELTGLARRDALDSEETDELLDITRRRFDRLYEFVVTIRSVAISPQLESRAPSSQRAVDVTLLTLLIAAGAGFLIAFGVARSTVRTTVAQQRDIDERDGAREIERRRNEQESRLHRAFEMARDEDAAIETVGKALHELRPGLLAEFLIADSSHAHVRRAMTTDDDGRGPGCGVGTPNDCPAVSRGQTLTFADSDHFDTCPHLRDRGISRCSAICVPVSIMGAASGVLHSIGPHDTKDAMLIGDLEQIANKSGERIGLLRAFSRSEAQASTDSLTGLSTRRNLEQRVTELQRNRVPYAVAFGDLDHFKQLNDVHGHETGDRALRLFARTLRDSIRPTDVAGRWGGEEFVLVLPHTTANESVTILERVRESLALALTSASTPAFTVSFGVSDFEDADAFDERVAIADAALLLAKRSGRNRVVVASPDTREDPESDDADAAELEVSA